MRLRLAFAAAALALAGCSGTAEVKPATAAPEAAGDVRALAAHMRAAPRTSPPLPRSAFVAVRDRLACARPDSHADELLVELMRFVALAGERDGHTGIFPLDSGHRQPMHLFPIRLYDFPEGVHVVAQVGGRRELVGKRLVAIEGVPVEQALALVRPLVPRDNPYSLKARAVQWLVTAEVLHGLGLTEDDRHARFTFADGSDVGSPRGAGGDGTAPRSRTASIRWCPRGCHSGRRRRSCATGTAPRGRRLLDHGRAVVSRLQPHDRLHGGGRRTVQRLAARPAVDRVIVDLRHNPGGNNHTYPPLLETLRELGRRVQLLVLVGRGTFSAAQNLPPTSSGSRGRGSSASRPAAAPTSTAIPPAAAAGEWLEHARRHVYWQKSRRATAGSRCGRTSAWPTPRPTSSPGATPC